MYPNSVDERHEAKSQKEEYYLSTRARSSREDTAVPFYKRALSAVKKSWSWQSDAPELKYIDEYIEKHVIFSALKEDMEIVRRKAVEYVYIQMLESPEHKPVVV